MRRFFGGGASGGHANSDRLNDDDDDYMAAHGVPRPKASAPSANAGQSSGDAEYIARHGVPPPSSMRAATGDSMGDMPSRSPSDDRIGMDGAATSPKSSRKHHHRDSHHHSSHHHDGHHNHESHHHSSHHHDGHHTDSRRRDKKEKSEKHKSRHRHSEIADAGFQGMASPNPERAASPCPEFAGIDPRMAQFTGTSEAYSSPGSVHREGRRKSRRRKSTDDNVTGVEFPNAAANGGGFNPDWGHPQVHSSEFPYAAAASGGGAIAEFPYAAAANGGGLVAERLPPPVHSPEFPHHVANGEHFNADSLQPPSPSFGPIPNNFHQDGRPAQSHMPAQQCDYGLHHEATMVEPRAPMHHYHRNGICQDDQPQLARRAQPPPQWQPEPRQPFASDLSWAHSKPGIRPNGPAPTYFISSATDAKMGSGLNDPQVGFAPRPVQVDGERDDPLSWAMPRLKTMPGDLDTSLPTSFNSQSNMSSSVRPQPPRVAQPPAPLSNGFIDLDWTKAPRVGTSAIAKNGPPRPTATKGILTGNSQLLEIDLNWARPAKAPPIFYDIAPPPPQPSTKGAYVLGPGASVPLPVDDPEIRSSPLLADSSGLKMRSAESGDNQDLIDKIVQEIKKDLRDELQGLKDAMVASAGTAAASAAGAAVAAVAASPPATSSSSYPTHVHDSAATAAALHPPTNQNRQQSISAARQQRSFSIEAHQVDHSKGILGSDSSVGSIVRLADSSVNSPAPPENRATVPLRIMFQPGEAEQYLAIFHDHAIEGLVSGEEVRSLFERSGLPLSDLRLIWELSDFDSDNALSSVEFICAMVLVARRIEGAELPAKHLPQELITTARDAVQRDEATRMHEGFEVTVPPPPLIESQQSVRTIVDDGQDDEEVSPRPQLRRAATIVPEEYQQSSSRSPVAGTPTSAAATPLLPARNPWALDESELHRFSATFYNEADPARTGFAGLTEVKEIFDRSGLPSQELGHIYKMSDLDGDGLLSLGEFICAMKLVEIRRAGGPLTADAPHELVASIPPSAPPPVATVATPPTIVMENFGCQNFGSVSVPQPDLSAPPAFIPPTATAAVHHVHDAAPRASRGDSSDLGAHAPSFESPSSLPQPMHSSIGSTGGPGWAQGLDARPPPVSPQQWVPSPQELPPSPQPVLNAGPQSALSPQRWVPSPQELSSSSQPLHNVEKQSPSQQRWTSNPQEMTSELQPGHSSGSPTPWAQSPEASPPQQGWSPPPPQQPVQSAGSPSLSQQRWKSSPQEAASESHSMRSGAPLRWAPSPDEMAAYNAIYEGLDPAGHGFVVGNDVGPLLEKSGLPLNDLAHIWDLSDVDRDARLSPAEFCIAMALVSGCRRGQVLPGMLPAELRALIDPNRGAGDWSTDETGTAAAHSMSGGHAPSLPGGAWAPTADELEGYKQMFYQVAGAAGTGGAIDQNYVKEVLQQSQLPMEDLYRIWGLAKRTDLDGVLLSEFVVAMALAARRYQALQEGNQAMVLPDTLPDELEFFFSPAFV